MPTGSIASSSTQVDPERPWLGLRSFDENASAYFFGRDAELRDIFERVQHRPLTVLFGQSGLGKTSLLRAGLVPRLRDAGFLPVVLRLEYEEGDPSPADQLRETLIQAARDGGVTLPRELPTDLWLLLHDPHYGFCADPSAASSATLPRPVLILDQFEEIFTLGERRPNAAEELCAALAVLAENRAPADLDARLADDDDLALRLRHDVRPVRVILSLREDFLHMLERWKRAVPAVMENRLELRLLTGPQALQAAIEPGKLRCRASSLPPIVSGTTGAAIVRFVADVAPEVPLDEIDAVPPLLSLLCAELNEQRGGPEDVIRPEQLRGRAEDILEKFYHRCFASHPSAVQVFVEERLLSPEGFRESTAEDTARHDLERAGLSTADANAALKKLVDDRLLVVEERGGIRRVELTHDVLTGIARRSRDFRREREATAARRRARSRLVVISIVIVSLVACVSGFVAYWTERQNAELKAMIEEAARSDRLVALDKIQSGEHADALAHLGRAHRYLPSSSLTAEIALPLILSSPLRSDLAVFRGHGGPVSSARFSADGKRVLTASYDKTARLWEAESGKLLASYEGHGGPVYSAQFSPDGKRVLTTSDDKTARLWEAESGKLLASYEGHGGYVSRAQFSPDGKRVLTASDDKTARLWEAESGKLLASYEGHGGPVYSAQFSADGKRVLTASDDKTARLWEAESGKFLASYEGHGGPVSSARFSADGKRVLTASDDKTARLWEAESGKLLASYEGHGGPVYSAQFSADGKRVLTASSDKTARLWEAESGKLLASYEGHGGYVFSAQFSADGKRVLTASSDKTARLWEAESGKLLASYEGHGGPVYSAQFSADGKRVLTASYDKTARLWEAESGKLLASYEGHGGYVSSAQFSADGKRVLTASDDKTARLWEAESGKLLASYEGHGGYVFSAQFSADGKRVLTASSDKTARLWEAESGKLLANYEGHGGYVSSAQFSADGKRVLTASSDKTARLWPLLPANIEAAEWFGDFLMFLGGQRIGEDGGMKILSNSERHAVESKLRQFARVKDDYSLLLRWQLTTTSDRTVDPYGTITQKQLASELISRGQDRDAMQRAYNLDPWNPVVHLALAEFEEDLEASDWLRHYSLDRLPDDPVLERQAADMLRKQHQPELALECIDRALKHTPQDPDALALRTAILKDLNR